MNAIKKAAVIETLLSLGASQQGPSVFSMAGRKFTIHKYSIKSTGKKPDWMCDLMDLREDEIRTAVEGFIAEVSCADERG